MTAYYNEIDPFAAEWLRALIAAGHIAPGDVDTRSIVDVRPDDLRGYTQCHFFAGIGVWSYALRLAGWPDDRPVWTMSCPCQPFSAAGKGGGFDDERHLWPNAYWLICQRRPRVVLGEQVASKDGLAWLDLVQADLEGARYTSGAVDTCSAGVGAPHIRQRLYWVGERVDYPSSARHDGPIDEPKSEARDEAWLRVSSARGRLGGVAHANNNGFQGRAVEAVLGAGRWNEGDEAGCSGAPLADWMADADSEYERGLNRSKRTAAESSESEIRVNDRQRYGLINDRGGAAERTASPTNGFWRDADWLFCRDERWRPVEPGTFPLAHGAPARVGRLRGYGNAINAEAACVFIEAYLETQAIDADRHLQLTEAGNIFD